MTIQETPVSTASAGSNGHETETRSRDTQPRRSRGPAVLVLATILALVLGAIAGGLVGYMIGQGSAADVQTRNDELAAQVADLRDDLGMTEDALDETLAQITACQDAILTADLILENRDAERQFLLTAAEGAVDVVLASEWLARDDEYLQLVAQYDMQADACVSGIGISPAAY